MILNIKHNTRPIIAHAPGKMEFLPMWQDVLETRRQFPAQQKMPNDVTVITFNNGGIGHNNKPLGLLEKYLQAEVLGKEINIEDWENRVKINLLYNFLPSVKTKFVLVCDSSDVIVLRKIKDIASQFEKMKCGACFNAERINWPFNLPQVIVDFENKINTELKLNAGSWIAYTDFAKKITALCHEMPSESKSEQWYYKHAYLKLWPKMIVDFECQIFQHLNRTDRDEIKLMRTVL